MSASDAEHIPIRTISSLTGVNPITLRAWERRYGLIRPLRTAKGHRLYTHAHVEKIRRVLTLVERGVPISQVGDLIDAIPESDAAPKVPRQLREYFDRMTHAIARLDEQELDQIYDEALSLHSIDTITRQLILPLLVHFGERWKTIIGAVAEEHFLATYLRSKLGSRVLHQMRYATGPRLIAACAPGEHHEIGLLLFALEAQAAGLRTVVLGADTPLEELAIAQSRSGTDGIVISSSIDPAPGQLEHALPKLVKQVSVPVFVGGGTANRHKRAIRSAGAVPLGTDLEDGVRLIIAKLKEEDSNS